MKQRQFWFTLTCLGIALALAWPALSQSNRIILSGADSVRDSDMTATSPDMPLSLLPGFIMQYVDGQRDIVMSYPVGLINQITPTVTPTMTPSPTATQPLVTPTAVNPTVTPSPTATQPLVTPTAVNPTVTPSPTATQPLVTPTAVNPTVTPSPTVINVTVTPMPLIPITLTVSSGVDSRRLDWNPLNDITVVGYQINRAISGTLNFATLTMVTDTRYYDTQSLVAGQAYCYRVTAIGPNQIALMTSNLVCATVGELELWIPDIVVGANQSTVIVPINIRNARGLRIGSADIWVTFKQNVISATETLSPTALTERGYAFNYGLTQNELLRVATNSGNPPELYGSGSLFWAVFQVRGQKGDITPLTLQEFTTGIGGTVLRDENFALIPLNLHHGTLRITDNCNLGDINCDTVIDAGDAGIALKLAAENPTPADDRLALGDINGNGVIDAGDSAMILYYAVNKVWPQISQIPTPRQTTSLIVVEVGQAQGRAGQLISLTVKASNLVDWSGGEFTLAYDTQIVQEITQVEPTGLAASFNGLRYLANGNGLLKVAMSTNKPVSGNGTLMIITLKLATNLPAKNTSPINLSEVRLYDLAGRDFSTSALQRQLERVNGQLTLNATIPVYLPLLRR